MLIPFFPERTLMMCSDPSLFSSPRQATPDDAGHVSDPWEGLPPREKAPAAEANPSTEQVSQGRRKRPSAESAAPLSQKKQYKNAIINLTVSACFCLSPSFLLG